MRTKKLYVILSFHTTSEAMSWENRCLEHGIPGRLIPLPREISAGCGLAWRMLPQDWEYWQERICNVEKAEFDKVVQVEQ